MFLSRIHLDPRCREVRRDLSDPYQLHATLCRAFSASEAKCPPNEFLWRLEPETNEFGQSRILIQSRSLPDWGRIGYKGWLATEPDRPIPLEKRLPITVLRSGRRFRFRLRANPSVCRNGKRLGLMQTPDQEAWLDRKGADQHGFSLPPLLSAANAEGTKRRIDVRISQEQMLRGRQVTGNSIRVFSVLYDGILFISDPDRFFEALRSGIGPGKALGLGLLSVIPWP